MKKLKDIQNSLRALYKNVRKAKNIDWDFVQGCTKTKSDYD